MNSKYETAHKVMDEVKKVIVGKDEIIWYIMNCIVAGGHCLLEDIPGVGKTTMALAFSKAMSLEYSRLQFTPDVMPSDVTGFMMYRKDADKFYYKKGAIMANVFLADEINRTSSRTQSALLEAMEEKAVTVDGERYELPSPFIVIATQNPVGFMGTSVLPESQTDRFLYRITIGYPSVESEIEMMKNRGSGDITRAVVPVIDAAMLREMQSEAEAVYVSDDIYEYIARIAECSRNKKEITLGLSPRGSLALLNASKAYAYLSGRDYVVPDDIRRNIVPVANHRIVLADSAGDEKVQIRKIIQKIMQEIVPPRE